MLASALLLLSLSACGGSANKSGDEANHAHSALHITASGDVQELTAGKEVLPSFLDGQHENIVLVYRAVSEYPELLDGMPCYCGCGDSAGHRSNRDCFIHEVKEDGSIVWDDHGTKCNVCLEIAVESIQMKQGGKAAGEIRTFIDEKYREGYAKPTDTPLPL
ncbi:PCYCGC motif-containing (lipo)protein [Paenibacillus ihumii]|uniref:PCYCGC motif-containing (lipo)protein n=1 Tax=Paenibacillus ihumii TaxID=687436 RepID=UPI0011DDCCC1|nr:PCYCGC motif-containing (lipo)protein [Paenibacillus ihumii]